MSKGENKFYVVWNGRQNGIFNSWDKCKESINGFSGARYKGFSNFEDAKIAMNEGREKYYQIGNKKGNNNEDKKQIYTSVPFFKDSIAVDAACSGNPGVLEYRGIDLNTGNEIFHKNFELGTNNIGEFLAIVEGLKYLKGDKTKKIYSDSRIAISRVSLGKCKTQAILNSDIEKAINNAEIWLQEYGIQNEILKWDTGNRGEIPADFGRK